MIGLFHTFLTDENFINWMCRFYIFIPSKRLLQEGHQIIGIDNLNSYYDIDLKKDEVKISKLTSSVGLSLLL